MWLSNSQMLAHSVTSHALETYERRQYLAVILGVWGKVARRRSQEGGYVVVACLCMPSVAS